MKTFEKISKQASILLCCAAIIIAICSYQKHSNLLLLNKKISILNEKISQKQQHLLVLTSEWSILNSPKHLRTINKVLKLRTIQPSQTSYIS